MNGEKPKSPTSDELKANRARLFAEKASVTGKISDTCRFVGFGLLAIFYTIKLDRKSLSPGLEALDPCLILALGVSGGLAIFFDYSRQHRYDH